MDIPLFWKRHAPGSNQTGQKLCQLQYDTFGRRIEKSVTSIHSKGASEGRQRKVIRFLWNGNNLFHEWEEKHSGQKEN